MVVQGREEAVVAAHVEHVDQAVPARRGQQAEKTRQIVCLPGRADRKSQVRQLLGFCKVFVQLVFGPR